MTIRTILRALLDRQTHEEEMKMTVRTILRALFAWMLFCGLAQADSYPARPVTIVVGFAAGGLADILARAAADFARSKRGATVIVVNQPGAAATIATERVTRSAPDGYTLTLTSPSPIWVLPALQDVRYDPLRDLTYIAQLITQPLPLYVRTDSPFKTYEDVLAYARANPGGFRWGTAGARGFAEIVVGAGFSQEKVDTTNVPFKGGAEAVSALLGGHIEAVASTDFAPQLRAGKVRLLVETGPLKAPGHAHIKTYRELNYPISASVFYGLMGPAKLAPDVIQWWETLCRELTSSREFAALIEAQAGLVSFQGYAEFSAAIRKGHAEFASALAKQSVKQ